MRGCRKKFRSYCLIATAMLLQACVTAKSLQDDVLDAVNNDSLAVQEVSTCTATSSDDLQETRKPNPFLDMSSMSTLDQFDKLEIDDWFQIGRKSLLDYEKKKTDGILDISKEQEFLETLGISSSRRLAELLTVPGDAALPADRVVSELSEAFPGRSLQAKVQTSLSPPSSRELVVPQTLMDSSVVAKVTARRGWDAAFIASQAKASAMRQLSMNNLAFFEPAKAQQIMEDNRKKRFIAEYFSAYFKHGEIFRVELITETTRNEFIAKLTEGLDEKAANEVRKKIEKTFSSLLERVCKAEGEDGCVVLGVKGEASFVSRAGKTISFPGVVATIDPGKDKKVSTNKLDSEDIGQELLEVLIEAVGDATYTVPAAENSTACQIDETLCATDKDKLSVVDASAARTEASARAVTSIMVRGGWLFSLNNESLASWLETFIAISARKYSEAGAWSKQQCEVDSEASAPDKFVELKIAFPPRTNP